MKQAENRLPVTESNPTVSRFVSEGNPNTDETITEAKKKVSDAPLVKATFDETLVKQTLEVIAKEKAISDEARHIDVTALEGKVILKGIVPTEQERMVLGDNAAAVAGFGHVKNLIEVKGE